MPAPQVEQQRPKLEVVPKIEETEVGSESDKEKEAEALAEVDFDAQAEGFQEQIQSREESIANLKEAIEGAKESEPELADKLQGEVTKLEGQVNALTEQASTIEQIGKGVKKLIEFDTEYLLGGLGVVPAADKAYAKYFSPDGNGLIWKRQELDDIDRKTKITARIGLKVLALLGGPEAKPVIKVAETVGDTMDRHKQETGKELGLGDVAKMVAAEIDPKKLNDPKTISKVCAEIGNFGKAMGGDFGKRMEGLGGALGQHPDQAGELFTILRDQAAEGAVKIPEDIRAKYEQSPPEQLAA